MKKKIFQICTIFSVLLFIMGSTMDASDDEHIDVIDIGIGSNYTLFV